MIRDISSLVEAAVGKRAEWTGAEVAKALSQLTAQLPGAAVDWEEGDEDWARVLSKDGDVVAYVCTRLPLVILDGREGLLVIATRPEVVCLEVPGMAAPTFRGEKHRLEAAFGRVLSPNIDYGAFSADDLWWATV